MEESVVEIDDGLVDRQAVFGNVSVAADAGFGIEADELSDIYKIDSPDEIRGFSQIKSGKEVKSRSADQNFLTPWCRQIEAIRASWIFWPLIFPAVACLVRVSK